MVLEIRDRDTLKALEAMNEKGIEAKVRDDREVKWIGDCLLQALFDISEIANDTRDDIIIDIPKMPSEIEWMLYEGASPKLTLIDQLIKEFFCNYERKKITEMSLDKGVVSIFTKF